MAIDIKASLSKPANAAKFTSAFIAAYTSPAFGTRSKTEIDLLVFSCLIEAGAIDPEAPEYDIARALNITPARVRNLILNWQLRLTPPQGDLRRAIVEALKKTRFSNDGKLLTFGVESPLLKEEITARLKRKGVFPDASFSKELVKLPADAFVEFLDEIVDDDTKKQVNLVGGDDGARAVGATDDDDDVGFAWRGRRRWCGRAAAGKRGELRGHRQRSPNSAALTLRRFEQVGLLSGSVFGKSLKRIADVDLTPRARAREGSEYGAAWAALRLLTDVAVYFSRLRFGANDGARAFGGERWSDQRGAGRDGQNQLRWGGAGRAPRATGS